MKRKIIKVCLCVWILAFLYGCGEKNIVETTDETVIEDEEIEEIQESEIVPEEVSVVKIDHSQCRLDSIETNEDNRGIAVYEGTQHDYILDLPDNCSGAPLVVMLHGYGGNAEAFRGSTAFEDAANDRGYAVVYVTGATSPEDGTSSKGWNSGIGISSNNDVDFICALVNELCQMYSFDRERIFAAGFSNGAFMTHRLAIEASDIFAAVVSVAGMMPENIWNTRQEECVIGVLQITGEKDDVVPKNSDGSANHSKAPAIEDVVGYYVSKNGLHLAETMTIGKKSELTKYNDTDSQKQIWNVFIPDGRHSWPEEQIVGFNTNEIILDFLDTQ